MLIRETFTDGWKLKETEGEKVYDVSIPASVLSVLLENGDIEDPFYRDNEKKCMALFEKDYEFTRTFAASGDITREDEVDLVFYGIDTLADIYLNGKRLSYTSSMHRVYRFPIKDKLISGANEIRVVLHSPLNYIKEYIPEKNKEIKYIPSGCMAGNQYIRKAHSSFGWDWGPKLPDMGLFRKVELEAYSKVAIKEVFFDQEHEDGRVTLSIDPILKITDSVPVEICVTLNGKEAASNVIRMPEEGAKETVRGRNQCVVKIDKPKLWWPGGQGEPYLYDVNIKIKKSDTVYDERDYKIGLRTMSVSRKKDEWGEEFAFVVNGRKIFAMGANYIPEDCIYPRITRERIEEIVKSAAKANFNTLRVWGGGYYPSDDFYDLCDMYGIIVWQDLMFACNVYDLNHEFQENITEEVHDNVKRLRHHACLGLWCGNNEIESAWNGWPGFKDETPYLKADYIKMFEHVLPEALREVDEDTFYWPSSPSSGGCFDNPDDENRGDCHYWNVWHGFKPFSDYNKHFFRFLSEFGFQSLPCKKTTDTFALPQDQNIFSDIMECHQKNDGANGKLMYYISQNFLYPKDFVGLTYVSQILQGLAIKAGVDHLRRNRGRCMGTLFWQINDNWPVVSWSSVDYYGRWKALQYMAKKFFSPIAGSIERIMDENGNETYQYAVSIVNESPEPVSYKVRLSVHGLDGKEIGHFDETGRVTPGKVNKLRKHDFSRYIEKRGPGSAYIRAEFAYSNGMHAYEYATFVPYKHMNLNQPRVTFDVREFDDYYELEVETDTFTPFVMLDFNDRDVILEDNAFTAVAGEPYVTVLKKSEIKGPQFESIDDLCSHIDIYFLQRSYMYFDGDRSENYEPVREENTVYVDELPDDVIYEDEEFGEIYDDIYDDGEVIYETEEELKERLRAEIREELRAEILREMSGESQDDTDKKESGTEAADEKNEKAKSEKTESDELFDDIGEVEEIEEIEDEYTEAEIIPDMPEPEKPFSEDERENLDERRRKKKKKRRSESPLDGIRIN